MELTSTQLHSHYLFYRFWLLSLSYSINYSSLDPSTHSSYSSLTIQLIPSSSQNSIAYQLPVPAYYSLFTLLYDILQAILNYLLYVALHYTSTLPIQVELLQAILYCSLVLNI